MEKSEELRDAAFRENIDIDDVPLFFSKAKIVDYDGIVGIAIDLSRIESHSEETMLLAHELGHYMTGSLYNKKTALPLRCKFERKAWEWAVQQCVNFDQLIELLKEQRSIPDIAGEMELHPELIVHAVDLVQRLKDNGHFF